MVAPMKMKAPSSTWCRKASCCALLKRCTSSMNGTVGRHARRVLLGGGDGRADFLDAGKHRGEAEIGVHGCRDQAGEGRLPVPGSPHSTSECRRPARSPVAAACRRRECLADDLIDAAGAHAVGERARVCAHWTSLRRVLSRADDVYAVGKNSNSAGSTPAALQLAETDLYALFQRIDDFHRGEGGAVEPRRCG